MKRVFLILTIAVAWTATATIPEISVAKDPLDNYYKSSLRPKGQDKLVVDGFVGEYCFSGVFLYNPGKMPLYLTVKPIGLPLTLREAAHLRAFSGQLTADILASIDDETLVVIPPRENRQLIVEFHPRQSGHFVGKLEITDQSSQKKQTFPVNFNVKDFRLQKKPAMSIFVWDHTLSNSVGKERENILRDMTEHGVNAFHLPAPMSKTVFDKAGNLLEPIDFSKLDSRILPLKGKGLMMLRDASPNIIRQKNNTILDHMNPAGEKAYRYFIMQLVDHMTSLGFGFDEYCLYPYDECLNEGFMRAARIIREVEPRVMIYADPSAGQKPSEVKMVLDEKLVDYLQIKSFCRNIYPKLFERAKKELKYTSLFWSPRVQKRFNPNKFYRKMGHEAFRAGVDGYGFWMAYRKQQARRNIEYDDFVDGLDNSTAVYPGRNFEILPSRRWHGFRRGLEDFYIFRQLSKTKGSNKLLQRVEKLYNDGLDYTETEKLRYQIMDFIKK